MEALGQGTRAAGNSGALWRTCLPSAALAAHLLCLQLLGAQSSQLLCAAPLISAMSGCAQPGGRKQGSWEWWLLAAASLPQAAASQQVRPSVAGLSGDMQKSCELCVQEVRCLGSMGQAAAGGEIPAQLLCSLMCWVVGKGSRAAGNSVCIPINYL